MEPIPTQCPFRLGDLVTSTWHPSEVLLVRRITYIKGPLPETRVEGGWVLGADGGEPCPSCGRRGTPTPPLCLAHFQKVMAKGETDPDTGLPHIRVDIPMPPVKPAKKPKRRTERR